MLQTLTLTSGTLAASMAALGPALASLPALTALKACICELAGLQALLHASKLQQLQLEWGLANDSRLLVEDAKSQLCDIEVAMATAVAEALVSMPDLQVLF